MVIADVQRTLAGKRCAVNLNFLRNAVRESFTHGIVEKYTC